MKELFHKIEMDYQCSLIGDDGDTALISRDKVIARKIMTAYFNNIETANKFYKEDGTYLIFDGYMLHADVANLNGVIIPNDEIHRAIGEGQFGPTKPVILESNHDSEMWGVVANPRVEFDMKENGLGLRVTHVMLTWGPHAERAELVKLGLDRMKFSFAGYVNQWECPICKHMNALEVVFAK